jgi:glycosyltransferase involved in cell wall biosynthesis
LETLDAVKMKVLYLTPFPPTRSGVADYAQCFQAALNKYSDWELKLPQYEEQISGNSLIDLKQIYLQVKKWESDGFLEDISIVHVEMGCMQYREFYTLIIIKYLYPSLPYCVTIHDPSLLITPSLYCLAFGSEAKLIKRFFRLLDYTPIGRSLIYKVLSEANCLFVLSSIGAQSLQKFTSGRTDVKVIPHVNYRSSIDENKANLSTIDDPTVKILFMGFWGKSKGLEILIDAIEKVVADSQFEVRLLLGGGSVNKDSQDPYVKRIEDKISKSPAANYIEILGYIDPSQVNYHLDNSDIFVLPYADRGSSSSGALYRAMSSGIAIVASKVGTFCEDIQHLENGMLAIPNNSEELAVCLLQLVNDKKLRLKLGGNAKIKSLTTNSREKVADITSKIYANIFLNHRNGVVR